MRALLADLVRLPQRTKGGRWADPRIINRERKVALQAKVESRVCEGVIVSLFFHFLFLA